ncbi:ester cyclase [Halomonas binhaiensis]|uniref:Ester cyclase n=2 Tax=Halomonas binhaiensis TaxID=2562282 RepID=A0A856QMM3_9GAMM|nr:ester cyclase [Halomonas binhaiensis]
MTITRLREALYDTNTDALPEQLEKLFAPDCAIHLAHPLGEMVGPQALHERGYAPLIAAIPDLERRDYITIGGGDNDQHWIGCAGFYTGVFERPWLDIPPTQHIVTMRYAEFFRLEDDRIVEMRALWDIPELMMQANAWPMGPSLGREFLVPGPATQDGLITGPRDEIRTAKSLKLVSDMLNALGQYAQGGVEAMNLEHYWHPRMVWYGPAGIGSGRRITGFRNWHQKPFLAGMPDRRSLGADVMFADNDYVGLFGWPALEATISQDGWLGIAPSGQRVTLRSLDFWRCEKDQIRENWVLVDLLDVFDQIGVDVLSRMRELTAGHRVRFPDR